ncbi:GTP 3',8-cyclase MoaA [Alteromonas gilva]|uniref:GTP 3',8-cyclase n=1 Tax=Alteromonas gilva TaxID=2987522 RepID=A0ABT5L3Z6_9ALTE|nr:GTP 3',8-cyclase MoaA [Alteromonas gilva]MDC8831762.1 GTP 3',8-cyclase MoaA [Alteromonas gilva]
MLQDSFGRRFYYLRLSITDVCNFRCQYCLPDGYQGEAQQFLSLNEISTLVNAFAQMGTAKIRITGGEPTLRRDITDVIGVCANAQGISKVAMTTHAGRLAKLARPLAKAGLGQVNISLDSLDPGQFALLSGHDKLAAVLDGIEAALLEGVNVKVNTVLLRPFAKEQLRDFTAWLKEMPVTVRFIELMETGQHKTFFKSHHISAQPYLAQLKAQGWTPIERSKDAGPAIELAHPDYAGRLGFIMPYSSDFCDSCNRLRITALGKLHLCLFADQGLDLRDALQSGDVAAVKAFVTDSLADKKVSHYLQEGITGITRNLSMLGG